MISEGILIIPIKLKVVHIGCMHETTYPAEVLIPAFNGDHPLHCPRCLGGRQWRLSYEEPGIVRGKPQNSTLGRNYLA